MSELLGVLFAIFIATMTFPKIAQWQQTSNDNNRIAITAQQQKQLDEAVTTYTQQNSVAIQALATSTVPATITVAMLQATNALPTAFSAVNPYGQTWQAEVLQPTAGNLQVLTLSTGGTTLLDKQVNKIAALVPSGGFIPQNDSGSYPGAAANAYGAAASWSIPTTNYTGITGGHPAALLTFNQGQLASNSLYRNAVPGQPQLNTMNTPLIMAASAVPGTACSPDGSIAQDGTGMILSCSNAIWISVSTIPCTHGSFTKYVAGTYTLPKPVGNCTLTISGSGGGGGGGGTYTYNGWHSTGAFGGAAAANYVNSSLNLDGSASYTITVGDGGLGRGDGAGPASSGGPTTVSSILTGTMLTFPGAVGGAAGIWDCYQCFSGAPTCASTVGQNGAASLVNGQLGGTGGACPTAAGSRNPGNPPAANAYGAGGGAASGMQGWWGWNGWLYQSGAKGANGYISITW